jgi:hypothetical protein
VLARHWQQAAMAAETRVRAVLTAQPPQVALAFPGLFRRWAAAAAERENPAKPVAMAAVAWPDKVVQPGIQGPMRPASAPAVAVAVVACTDR